MIANPASRGGRTRALLEAARSRLEAALGPFDIAWTTAPGDAARAAESAGREGRAWVVAVGGDGTASEVVTGLVASGPDAAHRPIFSVLPAGTGNDLARTLGAPRDLIDAARWAAASPERRLDVGVARRGRGDGERPERDDPSMRQTRTERCFVNVADAGVGGEIAVLLQRSSKRLRAVSYLTATARGLLAYRDRRVRYRLDGGPWVERSITALCVCNGAFFGSGMNIAPGARVDDGLFDVTVLGGLGPLDLLRRGRKLYDGRLLDVPGVESTRAARVEIAPAGDAPARLDLDGDAWGAAPATFEIMPGALRLRGGRE